MLSQMLNDYEETSEAGKKDMFMEATERMIEAEERLQRIEAAARNTKRKLETFRDEAVKADMIVPMWVNDTLDELTALEL